MDKTSSPQKANTRQVGGAHYKIGGEEHWDRVNRLGLDYFQGQITKYVERWKKKNGIEDLKKALHFLEKYIELNSVVDNTHLFGGSGGTGGAASNHFKLDSVNDFGSVYSCSRCGAQVFTKSGQLPWDVHGDCPNRNYVNQD